jgi:hypothetical protein
MSSCRRCTECRKTFMPARCAASAQCVCGAVCRRARDRKLARIRRGRDLEGARAEERARRQSVDRALDVSRASLMRDLRGILGRLASIPGNASTADGGLSRATLRVQAPDIMVKSGVNLATPSRMSLGDRRPT